MLVATVALLLLVASFLLGANHFREQRWPFGRHYLSTMMVRLSSMREDPARPVQLRSVFAGLEAHAYTLPFDDGDFPSGPFEALSDDEFLFIGKCGELVFADIADPMEGSLHESASSNLDAHRRTQSGTLLEPVDCERHAGVKGSALGGGKLYVAMHVRNTLQPGLQMVVREYRLAGHQLAFERELFRSYPPVQGEFREEFSGGKLALMGDGRLAVALGDFEHPELVQRDGNSMGKVFMIDLADGRTSEYTRGHRSPSGGLCFDAATRQLWLTEHGPQGGDEINLLVSGANYGWPVVSYGNKYGEDYEHYAPYAANWNNHEGYEKPKFSFVPSIGIGPVAVYPQDGVVSAWRGDLIVAGMRATTLYRAHRAGKDAIANVEPLLQGFRIRDIRIGAKGQIYLKTDDNQFIRSEGTIAAPATGGGEGHPVAVAGSLSMR